MDKIYRIFVNGAFLDGTDVYDYAMNRGLGIAMFLKLPFLNTKSSLIIDKWSDGANTVIITKNI